MGCYNVPTPPHQLWAFSRICPLVKLSFTTASSWILVVAKLVKHNKTPANLPCGKQWKPSKTDADRFSPQNLFSRHIMHTINRGNRRILLIVSVKLCYLFIPLILFTWSYTNALFYYSITIFLKSYFCCLIIHIAQTKQSKSTYGTGVYIPFKRKAKGAGRDQPIFWIPCHVGHRGSGERKYMAKCELFQSWSTNTHDYSRHSREGVNNERGPETWTWKTLFHRLPGIDRMDTGQKIKLIPFI